MSGFKCQDCGKRFKTVRAAEQGSFNGCPKCGCDIDLDNVASRPHIPVGHAAARVNENSGQ
jgi:predicted  nucleic acid-binding Zn-ribbon protein